MDEVKMPQYKSHKIVSALKILNVTNHNDGSATITPVEHGYSPFAVNANYVKKHSPVEDGYYVVYEGGYESFSPTEAFESGYTRID